MYVYIWIIPKFWSPKFFLWGGMLRCEEPSDVFVPFSRS